MIDELNAQYVKVAKAKGLSHRRILGVHALRNAGIPYVTLLGWEIIRAVAGYTVVVEIGLQLARARLHGHDRDQEPGLLPDPGDRVRGGA